jgi:hypothetical protein
LAGENLSARFVVPTVGASINVVVHASLESTGSARCARSAVPWRVEGDVVEIAELFVRRGDELYRAGAHHDRFKRVTTTLNTYGHQWPDADESSRAAVAAALSAREDSSRTA